MVAPGLNAPRLLFLLGVVLGPALAVESVLTRGGQRLAKQAEEENSGILYTDSAGNNLHVSTLPKHSDTVREGAWGIRMSGCQCEVVTGEALGANWASLRCSRCMELRHLRLA